jgi:bifunctional UDP-N-acetylglucosamine pyrophosphorylase/glucosamine-1-phosphate N-acetyltransferase
MGEGVFVAVLAAGESTRIKSGKSKLLHELCGKPVLEYPVSASLSVGAEKVFLVTGGPHRHEVEAAFSARGLEFVYQEKPLGTGHAVVCLQPHLPGEGLLLVLPGDGPLIRPETLRAMLEFQKERGARAVVLTARLPDPTGYGRVFRNPDGGFLRVIEHHEATDEEKKVDEVCSGIYVFELGSLFKWLGQVGSENRKNEYYLPGVLELIQKNEGGVWIHETGDWAEILGVNTRGDLATACSEMVKRLVRGWMEEGVTFVDPKGIYLEPDVRIGRDAIIYPWAALIGRTVIGERAVIMPGAVLVDAEVAPGVRVRPGYYEKERLS